MNISAICFIDNSIQPMTPLVIPDRSEGWVMRYLWIQHRENNEDFVKNYFNGGNNTGLNVRKQTTHLQSQWKNHNAAFDQSAVNGDLIWRVKAYNSISQSIDYVEIWKDLETVNRIFEAESKLDNGEVWSKDQKSSLGQGVWDAGFIVRHYRPYQSISKPCAEAAYKMFVGRYKNKDKCIINTPMKLIL
jgi:hypothetical protein